MKKASLLLCVFLSLLLAASVVTAPDGINWFKDPGGGGNKNILDSLLAPFSGVNIANTYNQFPTLFDFIIYAIFFISISQFALSKQFTGRGGKGVIVAVGVTFAIAITVYTESIHWRLVNLGPAVLLFFTLVLGWVIYHFMKGIGMNFPQAWAFAFLFALVSLSTLTPAMQILDKMAEASPFGAILKSVIIVVALVASYICITTIWKTVRGQGGSKPDESGAASAARAQQTAEEGDKQVKKALEDEGAEVQEVEGLEELASKQRQDLNSLKGFLRDIISMLTQRNNRTPQASARIKSDLQAIYKLEKSDWKYEQLIVSSLQQLADLAHDARDRFIILSTNINELSQNRINYKDTGNKWKAFKLDKGNGAHAAAITAVENLAKRVKEIQDKEQKQYDLSKGMYNRIKDDLKRVHEKMVHTIELGIQALPQKDDKDPMSKLSEALAHFKNALQLISNIEAKQADFNNQRNILENTYITPLSTAITNLHNQYKDFWENILPALITDYNTSSMLVS